MNKVIWKDNLTEIKKSWPRFLSILLIMLLGVAFFVGIRATSPAMVETARQFFEDHNLPDGQILSTMGLEEADIQLIKDQGLTVDPLMTIQTTLEPISKRVKVYPNTGKNYFFAVEGKLPEASNEIALDVKYQNSDLKIGDHVQLQKETISESNQEESTSNSIKAPELTQTDFIVTGFVDTPLYYSKNSRGVGNINGYVLVGNEAIVGDIYTEVFYWSENAKAFRAYSPEYNQIMGVKQKELELAFKERPEVRISQIKIDLQEELNDGSIEIEEGYAELASAESDLDSAKQELEKGSEEYESGSKKLEDGYNEYESASEALEKGKEEYESGLAKIESGETEFQAGSEEIQTQEETLNNGESEYNSGLAEYENGYSEFTNEMSNAEALLAENESKLVDAKLQLDEAKSQIDNGLIALESGETELSEKETALSNQLQETFPNLGNQPAEGASLPDLALNYLKEELTKLTNQKTSLSNQIEAAPIQIEEINTRVAEIEVLLVEANTANENLGISQVDVAQQLTNAEAAVVSQQLITDQSQLEYNDALNNRDLLAAQLVNLEVGTPEYADVEAKLSEAELALKEKSTLLNEQLTILSPLVEARDSIQQNIDEINEQITSNEATITNLTDEKTGLTTQLTGLNQLLSPEMAEQLNQLTEAETALQGQVDGLQNGITEIATAKELLATKRLELEQAQTTYQQGLETYQTGLTEFNNGQTELVTQKAIAQTKLDTAWAELETARQKLDQGWNLLAEGKKTLDNSKIELENGRLELEDALIEISDGEEELISANKKLEDSTKELAEALEKLQDGEKEYQENLDKFNTEKIEALVKLEDAEKELIDGQKKIDELKTPTYYLNQRDSFDSYDSLYDNANQIKQISTVFPVFFFAIAVLVTFTTIKRMVSEQRNYMGTLKQMGYPNHVILSKFLTYALIATAIGTFIGIELGYRIFPPVIMDAYNSLFHFDNPVVVRSNGLNAMVAIIALSCGLIPAIWSPLHLLQEEPARLLKPEPPKAGKKIFLERISIIWNRLSFNRKMTIRNLLRYKGRNLMTLIGVAGCTMLIVTGFGISDTIDDLVITQFTKIQKYDTMLYLDNEDGNSEINQLITDVKANQDISNTLELHTENWQTDVDAAVQSVNVMVPLADYQHFLDIHERNTPKTLVNVNEFDGAIISERLAEYVDVTVGEQLHLVNDDGDSVTIPVSKIIENYIAHYVYLSPQSFQKYFNKDAIFNGLLIDYSESADVSLIENELSEEKGVTALLSLGSVKDNVQETMGSLGVITLVLIISAAALAFVVLYNLTNINVSERMRELSTIKVLGFYNHEVSFYIYDEILILTTIGSILGLGLGVILNQYILKTIQMPNLFFYPIINWESHLISAVMTFIFASIVMLVMHQKLKKIDMVEALKAVE